MAQDELSDRELIEAFNQFLSSCRFCSGSPSLTSLLEPKRCNDDPCNSLKCPFIASILNLAATWGWSNGITMLQDGNSTLSARLAPFALLPTPISRKAFDFAVKLSPIFSQMTANMTLSTDWLYRSLKSVGELDPQFTQRLLDIAQRSYGDGKEQRTIEDDIRLILIRSDYMIDHKDGQDRLQQVELNTISLSFAGLADSLTTLHRMTTSAITGQQFSEKRIPKNICCKSLSEALRAAHNLYCSRYRSLNQIHDVLGICILFVVRSNERNEIDQRKLEFHLAEYGANGEDPVPVRRMTFEALTAQFSETPGDDGLRQVHYRIVDENGQLIPVDYDGRPKKARLFISDQNHRGYWEVSLVYYRCGYDPSDYETDADGHWLMREVLERSDAIKVPNILTHLAGVKKIQSLWKNPDDLAICLPNETDRQLISQTFVDQVDPNEFRNNSDVLKLVKEAIQSPDDFVLKPQREGGLHNLHDEDLKQTLEDMLSGRIYPNHDGNSFILMRKIRPQVLPSITLDKPSLQDCSKIGTPWAQPRPIVRQCLSELGTFGIHLANGRKEVLNLHGGHLLRTKDARNKEGGVATGAAFLDSPLLVDDSIWILK